jgi:hypothetical protein
LQVRVQFLPRHPEQVRFEGEAHRVRTAGTDLGDPTGRVWDGIVHGLSPSRRRYGWEAVPFQVSSADRDRFFTDYDVVLANHVVLPDFDIWKPPNLVFVQRFREEPAWAAFPIVSEY